MGDDIREHCIWKQANNIQNIKITCITQHLENKEPNLKMGRGVFFQRHMDDYQTHETMFSFTYLQRNANQIQGDTSLLSEWQKKKGNKQKLLVKMYGKGNSRALLVACKHNGKQYEGSSKIKNRTTIQFSHSTPEHLPKRNKITNSKIYTYLGQ